MTPFPQDAAAKLAEMVETLEGELRSVDEALARRPALARIRGRYAKVFRACEVAGRAEKAEQDLARVIAVLEKYENCRHGSVNCFCTKEARAELFAWKQRGQRNS